jgi:hypothetical protein
MHVRSCRELDIYQAHAGLLSLTEASQGVISVGNVSLLPRPLQVLVAVMEVAIAQLNSELHSSLCKDMHWLA